MTRENALAPVLPVGELTAAQIALYQRLSGGEKCRTFGPEEVALAVVLYNGLWTMEEVGSLLGKSIKAVRKSLQGAGVKTRIGGAVKGRRQGERRERKYPLDHAAFDEGHTRPEASYFLGLLLTDGSLLHAGGSTCTVTLAQSEPREQIVYQFRAFLKSEKPVYVTTPKQVEWNRSHQLTVCSRQMFDRLVTYGIIQNKTSRQTVDPRLRGNVAFTRGVFDGDGTMMYTEWGSPMMRFGSTSPDLAAYWVEFCKQQIGTAVNGCDRELPSGKIHTTLCLQGGEAAKMADILYGKEEVSIGPKQELANAFIQWGIEKGHLPARTE